jgi:ribonuclease-3
MDQQAIIDEMKVLPEIDIQFENLDILALALVHRSYINESKSKEHNERLEFLGDAVLEIITTDFLFKKFPDKPEGELTSHRSALVKGEHLAKVAYKINLGIYLKMSKGEEKGGGRKKDYILANTFEALLGAIYLDHGYAVSEKFVKEKLVIRLHKILDAGLHIDAKSHFQEIAQEKTTITPNYRLIKEEGPDHSKVFTMGVYLNKKLYGEGTGQNKQIAEQAAAKNALEKQNWD